jgi:hypothetical protein
MYVIQSKIHEEYLYIIKSVKLISQAFLFVRLMQVTSITISRSMYNSAGTFDLKGSV